MTTYAYIPTHGTCRHCGHDAPLDRNEDIVCDCREPQEPVCGGCDGPLVNGKCWACGEFDTPDDIAARQRARIIAAAERDARLVDPREVILNYSERRVA